MSSRIAIEQTGRNVICSVVFVDLVEYTRKSVAEQLAIKDRFTELIAEALKDIPVNDRIVLDTGDGAAMSFLGDPEDALFVGMSLRDRHAGGIRVGINLGPVRLVKDINGHPNIVGDGINVAQRIMSFAEPGQILASRSYFDVVSCLSDEYARLFSYEGSRTDKHVREHEVYVVGESASAYEHAKTGMASRATQPHLRAAVGTGRMTAPVAAFRTALVKFNEFLGDRRKVSIAAGVLGGLILLLAASLALRSPAPRATVPVAAAPPPAVEAEKPAAAAPQASAESAPASPERAKPEAAKPAPAPAKARVVEAKKGAAPQPAAAPGRVRLAISPWGEIFVDGKSRGVSPPMKSFSLPPGRHKIEVRNTTFAPHVAEVEVKSGGRVTVQHVFK